MGAHSATATPASNQPTNLSWPSPGSLLRPFLGPEYQKIFTTHRVAHVYNHWSYMPSLAERHNRLGTFTAPFTVLRLLTSLKMSYEAAKKRSEPYDKIVGELPEMGFDTVNLVTGDRRESKSICAGEQSLRGQCAVDHGTRTGFLSKHHTAG